MVIWNEEESPRRVSAEGEKNMPKELTRDSASDAFRFWAFIEQLKGRVEEPKNSGVPDIVGKYKRLLYADIYRPPSDGIRSGISDPTVEQLIRMEQRLENAKPVILDMEAVERTFEWLRNEIDGEEVLKAVRSVYMVMPHRLPDRHEIRDRTLRHADGAGLSINTLYRRLKKARFRWAMERGLKIYESKDVY